MKRVDRHREMDHMFVLIQEIGVLKLRFQHHTIQDILRGAVESITRTSPRDKTGNNRMRIEMKYLRSRKAVAVEGISGILSKPRHGCGRNFSMVFILK